MNVGHFDLENSIREWNKIKIKMIRDVIIFICLTKFIIFKA